MDDHGTEKLRGKALLRRDLVWFHSCCSLALVFSVEFILGSLLHSESQDAVSDS